MAKNRKNKQDSRRLVLNYWPRFLTFQPIALFFLFFLYSSIAFSLLFLSHQRTQFNTPHHLFPCFYSPLRRTINFPDLNPGRRATTSTHRRPLPLPWWVCTTRRARKCGLYKLRGPLFTGLTTYLRELSPFRFNLDIWTDSLSVALSILYLASFLQDETYQTHFRRLRFFYITHILLPSSYLFISHVVSFASHTLTPRRSKRIIKSAWHSMKPFIVFHVAGFIILVASR